MGTEWPTFPIAPEMSGSMPSRPLTATGKLREQQRVEATRQAMTELSVLTEQLIELPDRLESSGIAKERAPQLQEAMEHFLLLANTAWEGMADNRFDEIVTTTLYRQRAVAASRRISRLQQEAASTFATTSVEGKVADKPNGPFWHARVKLYERALLPWRDALKAGTATPKDIFALGDALESVRAAVGLAGIGTLSFLIFRIITWVGLIVGGFAASLAVAVASSALTLRAPIEQSSLVITSAALALWWGFTIWALVASNRNLWKIQGTVRMRLHEREYHTSQGMLAGWRWFSSVAVTLGMFGAIGYAGWLIHYEVLPDAPLRQAGSFDAVIVALAGSPLTIIVGLAGVLLLAPFIISLPVTLTYQGMLAQAMVRNTARLPVARRSVIRPALHTLTLHLLLLFLVVGAIVPRVVPNYAVHVLASWMSLRVTAEAAIGAGIVLVGFLVLIEIPYRFGQTRWRSAKVAQVSGQRTELSTKLERLGPEPSAATDANALAYDVNRLRFLEIHERSIRRMRGSAFPWLDRLAALAIIVIVALLLDNGLAQLAQRFTLP